MRNLILPAAAAIAVSACSPEQSAEERAAAEQNITSAVVATNDTTAIDAATGQDANMAGDVDFMPEIENEADGNQAAQLTPTQPTPTQPTPAARPRAAATATARPRTPAPAPAEPETPATEQPDEPESNSP